MDCEDYEIKAIVIAGTGSCSYGTNGEVAGKVGGYGHRIGRDEIQRKIQFISSHTADLQTIK